MGYNSNTETPRFNGLWDNGSEVFWITDRDLLQFLKFQNLKASKRLPRESTLKFPWKVEGSKYKKKKPTVNERGKSFIKWRDSEEIKHVMLQQRTKQKCTRNQLSSDPLITKDVIFACPICLNVYFEIWYNDTMNDN